MAQRTTGPPGSPISQREMVRCSYQRGLTNSGNPEGNVQSKRFTVWDIRETYEFLPSCNVTTLPASLLRSYAGTSLWFSVTGMAFASRELIFPKHI